MSLCPYCGGTGGAPIYTNGSITGRNLCRNCAGTGTVRYAGEGNSNRSQSGISGRSGRNDPVEAFAGLVSLLIWGGIAYIGIVKLNEDWPAPVFVGLISGVIVGKIFTGPLRHITEMIIKVIQVLFFLALGLFVAYLYFENK